MIKRKRQLTMSEHMTELRERRKLERREDVMQIVNEFRGDSHGETLDNFAIEVIRLRRGYRVLAEAVSEIRAGRMVLTLPQGPVTPNIKPFRADDIADGFIENLATAR